MLIRLFAVLMAMFITVSAHARSAVMLEPERVTLHRLDGKKLTQDDVRRAIVAGTQPFGWDIEQDKPGALQVRYIKNGKHIAVVRIEYDATGYQIKYVSSMALNFEMDSANTRVIHPTYNLWIKNLLTRIMVPGEVVPGAPAAAPAPDATNDD